LGPRQSSARLIEIEGMAATREAGYSGPSGHHIAGSALIPRVYLIALNARVFTLAPLPFVSEPLPLLSHFGQERFEPGIGC
jgi:hypothetical protein